MGLPLINEWSIDSCVNSPVAIYVHPDKQIQINFIQLRFYFTVADSLVANFRIANAALWAIFAGSIFFEGNTLELKLVSFSAYGPCYK